MNTLILSNSARGYFKFFNRIAENLLKDGHNVILAADCEYSAYVNHIAGLRVPVYIFSRHFAEHKCDSSLLEEYAEFNLNAALLPDFERAQVFNLWGRKDKEYFAALKSALLSFYTEIYEKHCINLVVFENVAGAFTHMAWFVCQRLNVRFFGLTSSRLPGRYCITGDPFAEYIPILWRLKAIEAGKLQIPSNVKDWVRAYVDNIEDITPDYMKFNSLDRISLKSRFEGDRLRIWLGALRFVGKSHAYDFNVGNPVARRIRIMCRTIARIAKVRRLAKYYQEPERGDRYFLYPLHYHPEASTSILAGSYLSELEVIRNIAFNLPNNVRLYVKDHLSAYGLPRLEFYESLARLPNVTLIHPAASTKALIRNSLGVVTLTSTVGYEALLMRKRVFLFGSVFYQFHPDVVRITDPSQLFEVFSTWLNRDLIADSAYNHKFIAAYYLSTLPGTLDLGGPDASQLADEVYPQLLQEYQSPEDFLRCSPEHSGNPV